MHVNNILKQFVELVVFFNNYEKMLSTNLVLVALLMLRIPFLINCNF